MHTMLTPLQVEGIGQVRRRIGQSAIEIEEYGVYQAGYVMLVFGSASGS